MPADTLTAPNKATNSRAKPVFEDSTDGYFRRQADESDEVVSTLTQGNDTAQRIGGACTAVLSDNMAAALEVNALTGRLLSDMTKGYIDALSFGTATLAALGHDSLACRTPTDVVNLQKKTMEGFTETYQASTKLYSDLFEKFSAAIEPLMSRTSVAPQRLFRAFAD